MLEGFMSSVAVLKLLRMETMILSLNMMQMVF